MSWKKIVKSPPLDDEDEKEIQELMRFLNMDRDEAERKVRKDKGKMGKIKQPTYDEYMRNYKSEDSLKKYRTNVSDSGMVPLDDVLKDHKELGLKLRGLMGAVGALRNNLPRRVSKVIDKLDEIKQEIQATEQLLETMSNKYDFEDRYNWDKSMEDFD